MLQELPRHDLIGDIPDPDAIRKRLSERLQEVRILKQLLKASETAAKCRQKAEAAA